MPRVSKPGPSTTAHATTGPHSAPRPTSSRPATAASPPARAASSKRVLQTISTPRCTRGRRRRLSPVDACAKAPPGAASGRGGRPLLLHAALLALALAQIVQLRPPHARLL